MYGTLFNVGCQLHTLERNRRLFPSFLGLISFCTILDSTPSDDTGQGASSSGGRADLMAAIRNAGGKDKAKLKSAKQRKVERKKEKEKSSAAASGGDLMSDLFSKLTMRRKGISGNKPEPSSGSSGDVSAMDRISAMIPPPKSRADTTDSADWE